MRYVCIICGYTYDEEKGDPDNGIEPGTLWEDLPDSFTCPLMLQDHQCPVSFRNIWVQPLD